MGRLHELQEEIYSDCRALLDRISGISGREMLLEYEPELKSLAEKVSFLKLINEYGTPEPEIMQGEGYPGYILDEDNPPPLLLNNENPSIDEIETPPHAGFSEIPSEPEIIPATGLELQQDEPEIPEPEAGGMGEEIPRDEDNSLSEELIPIQEENFNLKNDATAIPEENFQNNPVEIIPERLPEADPEQKAYEDNSAKSPEAQANEKKFRLAQIRNLQKNTPSLFDDPAPEPAAKQPESLAKSNMPVDYMEAPRPKQDFRLDLNDRIAFTQHLFGGSQADLNDTIQRLNGFKTLDEAKEFLSDLYYEKHWKKADEFAQRLWMLVENKFL